jgi:hypothetical protein
MNMKTTPPAAPKTTASTIEMSANRFFHMPLPPLLLWFMGLPHGSGENRARTDGGDRTTARSIGHTYHREQKPGTARSIAKAAGWIERKE